MGYIVCIYGVLCTIFFLATTGLRVNCFSTISRNQIRNSRIFKTISYSNSFYTVRGMHNYKHYTSPMRQSVALGGSSNDNSYYQGMDAYQILGVPRNADKKTIKAAYRKAVATWHPDKFPDDEAKKKEGGERMEKINRAWFCLGDDDRKSRYDQYGEEGVGSSAASEEQIRSNGGPGMGGFGGMTDMGDISDIFETFFGGGGVSSAGGGRNTGRKTKKNMNTPEAGEDLSMEVDIPFMTAIKGGEHTVRVRRMEACGTCTGTGVKPGAKIKTCGTCQGQGAVNAVQRTPFGVFNSVQPCPQCQGKGQEVEEYCGSCKGKGKGSVPETKEVTIKIPAGVEAGATMRVRNGGHAGRKGGANGDLYIQLNVQKDPIFRREGQDIYTIEEIFYIQAILGTTIQAHTIDGTVEVKIPSGTQPEQKLRLRGKGAPGLGSSQRGDAYITVRVRIPGVLTDKERELIQQLAVAHHTNTTTTASSNVT